MGARGLGERLLGEVEVEGLSEVLGALRERDVRARGEGRKVFGVEDLDKILLGPASRPWNPEQPPRQVKSEWDIGQGTVRRQDDVVRKKEKEKIYAPILELVSLPPSYHPSGAGKTSLIYLITALAVLPPTFSSVQIGGQNAAIVILDPLSHLSVPRLIEVMTHLILSKLQETNQDSSTNPHTSQDIKALIKRTLPHIHIFRPQSWPSLLTTLFSLPAYLFDKNNRSTPRHLHALVLEDVDAFYYDLRSSSTGTSKKQSPVQSASADLTSQLQTLSQMLSCAVILTSHSLTPSSFRPPIPSSWPASMQVTRLAIRRVEMLDFAPGISVEEAGREKWEVARRGRFECWRVRVGGRDGEGRGVIFRVGRGVEVAKRNE